MNLTIFVGPQATGKSIFLQLLKFVIDHREILHELRRFNIDWDKDLSNFLDLYLGEGMSSVWSAKSSLTVDNKVVDLPKLVRSRARADGEERVFFIPAQRVMSLRDGMTRPFTDYRSGDPFVLRDFSEKLHRLVQTEFGNKENLFPQSQRMRAELRRPIAHHIFAGFGLHTDSDRFQKRIVLNNPQSGKNLPYLVWSAGQREFVPLLLGFYWLMPPSKVSRRNSLDWVVIEELEMGLHPNAISVVLLQVVELLRRGYRVCLSSHSPHVLDVVWALKIIQSHGGTHKDVLRLFDLRASNTSNELAKSVLTKKLRVHFFTRDGIVHDISSLNPDSSSQEEAGWGGLTEFSGRVGNIVADVVNRN